MKKSIKTIITMAITMAIFLSALPNTFAAYDSEPNDIAAAHAVLRGVTGRHGEAWLLVTTTPSEVTINADGSVTVSNGNPWNFFNDHWTVSKEELLNAMSKEIENAVNTEYINSVDFDISLLKDARGKFYESYVCEYWRRLNQLKKETSGNTWSEIDEFFVTNCIDQAVPIQYGDGVFVCAASLLNFSDLPLTHWAADNIARIANLGYFSGYEDGTFKPDKEITHEEFTKIIVDVAGLTVTPVNGSSSTLWASWAQPYLNAALAAGIITQNDSDIMQVNKPMTRAEMAKMIGRLRLFLKKDDDNDVELNDEINDWDTIPDEYKQYIAKAYNADILKGYNDGSFKPNGKLTRAEASTVILKLIDEKDKFTLFINGKLFKATNYDISINLPIMTDKDMLVGVRDLFDILKINTEWNDKAKMLTCTKTGYGTCRLAIGSNTIEKKDGDKWVVCNENIEPARIINDRTIVPLFAIIKGIGMDIDYDKATNTARINFDDVKSTPEHKATAEPTFTPTSEPEQTPMSTPVTNEVKVIINGKASITLKKDGTPNVYGNTFKIKDGKIYVDTLARDYILCHEMGMERRIVEAGVRELYYCGEYVYRYIDGNLCRMPNEGPQSGLIDKQAGYIYKSLWEDCGVKAWNNGYNMIDILETVGANVKFDETERTLIINYDKDDFIPRVVSNTSPTSTPTPEPEQTPASEEEPSKNTNDETGKTTTPAGLTPTATEDEIEEIKQMSAIIKEIQSQPWFRHMTPEQQKKCIKENLEAQGFKMGDY